MSVWLSHLVLNALGLGLLGLLAWAAIGAWRREAGTVYRFLILVLVLAVLLPGVQLLLPGLAPAGASAPAAPGRAMDIEVKLILRPPGAPPAEAERESPWPGSPG